MTSRGEKMVKLARQSLICGGPPEDVGIHALNVAVTRQEFADSNAEISSATGNNKLLNIAERSLVDSGDIIADSRQEATDGDAEIFASRSGSLFNIDCENPPEEVGEVMDFGQKCVGGNANKISVSGNSNMHNSMCESLPEDLALANSSSSSSSSSTCSSSSHSFSEVSDDSIADKTYLPTKEDAEDSDESEEDIKDTIVTGLSSITTTELPGIVSTVISRKEASPSAMPSTSQIEFSRTGNEVILTSPLKKGIKRKRNEKMWHRNLLKEARNSGKEYEMWTKDNKVRKERKMKAPCLDKCRYKCSTKFSEEERLQLFLTYWGLGNLEKQRQFIKSSMQEIQPRYRLVRVGGIRPPRHNNMGFYFQHNAKRVRVCKLFFMNTLDINSRPIRTVLEKQNKVANVLMEEDKRGKHGKQRKIDERIKDDIKQFINAIPKIESHYTRANTSKHFIDGSKTISEIHKDYVAHCREKNTEYGNYTLFYRLFTTEFNISFFVPKKDQCDLCTAYVNAEGDEKKRLEENYNKHLAEKELSRAEKKADKETEIQDTVVAVYDLQAVLQLPKGDVSVFYYKSKLNVLNFTVYNLQNNSCECYIWDESNGHRGVNELGTCVLQYLKENADKNREKDFIFYSDNCAGQQKNKFMIAIYLYAVRFLNIKSITHKYLIRGHTQNEGDSAHSLIERNVKRLLKSGPMYTPETYISAIRTARKSGEPFHVHEMCYDDFYDMKQLQIDIGPINMGAVKITEVKVLKVVKESPNSLFYKLSYSSDNFQETVIIKKKKRTPGNEVVLTSAFTAKPGISERKKHDLMELVTKNLIPKYYKNFYNAL